MRRRRIKAAPQLKKIHDPYTLTELQKKTENLQHKIRSRGSNEAKMLNA
jgi:hypothetical protein